MNLKSLITLMIIIVIFYEVFAFPLGKSKINTKKRCIIVFFKLFKLMEKHSTIRVIYKSILSILWIVIMFCSCNLLQEVDGTKDVFWDLFLEHKYASSCVFALEFILFYNTFVNISYKTNIETLQFIKEQTKDINKGRLELGE